MSVLTRDQKQFHTKAFTDGGDLCNIRLKLRYDDECRNGHNSFAATAEISRRGRIESCGCLHDEIAKHFPEFAHLLKWHLCSSDGPMHYLTNTVFHAGDRDCYGRSAGQVSNHEYGIRFNGVPITHRVKKSLYEFISDRLNTGDFSTCSIAYPQASDIEFKPKWTLVGYADKWHQCPFDDKTEADEFCEALNTCKAEMVQVPTAWSDGKKRDFDAARSAAIWPDATDEQLSAPPDELKQALLDRLPTLLEAFRKDIEALGFVF